MRIQPYTKVDSCDYKSSYLLLALPRIHFVESILDTVAFVVVGVVFEIGVCLAVWP